MIHMTEMQQISGLFIFWNKVDFSELSPCNQTHQPIITVVRIGCHLHFPVRSTSVAVKLTICVSQHQALCDIRDANCKNNNL